jgi:hypothetical protein
LKRRLGDGLKYFDLNRALCGEVIMEVEDMIVPANLRVGARKIWALAITLAVIFGAVTSYARESRQVQLMNRVNYALHANNELNGASAYTAAPGVIVLYGTVFNDKDRTLAEQTANAVPGVSQVVDNLRTKTGKWFQDEERIEVQLQANGFTDVQARVVGPAIYLSGNVTGKGQKQRAANVAASVFPDKQINNFIWEEPGSVF